VTTDIAGHFRFDHLAPGEYELDAATLHDARNAKRIVAAGTTNAVLALVRPVCISSVRIDPPRRPSSPIIWDDKIELVGWDLSTHARVGEPFQTTLVFRVKAPIAHAWKVFAHFEGAEHYQNADHAPVNDGCATSMWKPGEIVVDRFSTTLPSVDSFTLKIGFFREGEGDERCHRAVATVVTLMCRSVSTAPDDLETFLARDVRVADRRDALDLGAMCGFAIARIAGDHAVRVERMEVASSPRIASHRSGDPRSEHHHLRSSFKTPVSS
jgi:hypothetical protein